jgi:hypothetical protein
MNAHTEIYLARNRTKRQHKIYLHEATINMLNGFAGGTVSENVNAIVCAFLQKIGKQMNYLDDQTLRQINEIRRALTT